MRRLVLSAVSAALLCSCATYPGKTKYGAIAISHTHGFWYGRSWNYASESDAVARAIKECSSRAADCALALSWGGATCGAVRTVAIWQGTAHGTGVADTSADADAIAVNDASRRYPDVAVPNHVAACNHGKEAQPVAHWE